LLGRVPERVVRAGRRDKPIAELPPLGVRVAGLAAVAVIVFAVILFRLWFLQILQGQQYVTAAMNNRIRTVTIPALRGVIYDSTGKELVTNRAALAVTLRLMDVPQGALYDEVGRLAGLLRTSPASLREYVARHAGYGIITLAANLNSATIATLQAMKSSLPGSYIDAQKGTVGLALRAATSVDTLTGKVLVHAVPNGKLDAVVTRLATVLGLTPAEVYEKLVRQASLAYDLVLVKEDVGKSVAERVLEHITSFPGVYIRNDYLRAYPEGTLAEHILGNVGEVTASELKQPHFAGLKEGDLTGQAGVEYTYDQWLRGRDGELRVEVDAMGNPKNTGVAGGVSAEPGDNLYLTINATVQKAAEDAIRQGIQIAHQTGKWRADGGAAVVMDVKTGAIIAMASYPTYDPTVYQSGTSKQFAALESAGSNYPLVNRAIAGLYPAGSTFKIVDSVAALEDGVVTPYTTIYCPPTFSKYGTTWKDWSYPSGFGNVNLPRALQVSCDVYFYNIGFMFYKRKGTELEDWALRLGFGHPTGIDIPGELSGRVPTPQWKRDYFKHGWDADWHPGDSVNLAIGQGNLLVTPLQMAVAYAAIANGGNIVTPHVGALIKSPAGQIVQRVPTPPARHLDISQTTLNAIREGLKLAANTSEGTSGVVFSGYPVTVAGKTGTAQQAGKDDTGWYASYAPADNPKYVVVVMIEQGGHGGTVAAPGARTIYDALFHIHATQIQSNTRTD
jgi:penicillin-binding protein 2